MLLAGDVGGTKTLIGLFEPSKTSARPRAVRVREFATLDFDAFEEIVDEFLGVPDGETEPSVTAVCVGVAGPVTGMVARLTNVPWVVDLARVAPRVGRAKLKLLNDLEAMAHAVTHLEPDELAVLQEGVPMPRGNAALIAAGTGLGQALLHNVGGRFVPSPSEGGHADFAPRNQHELALAGAFIGDAGRAEVETFLSGPGIVNIYRFAHYGTALQSARGAEVDCAGVPEGTDLEDAPAAITSAAFDGRCPKCVETLETFVGIYGSEAGNLALRAMATAGIYLGGGIAPKILPALEGGAFRNAFRDKAPMADLLATIPIRVILNDHAGLVGASVHAQHLAQPVVG